MPGSVSGTGDKARGGTEGECDAGAWRGAGGGQTHGCLQGLRLCGSEGSAAGSCPGFPFQGASVPSPGSALAPPWDLGVIWPCPLGCYFPQEQTEPFLHCVPIACPASCMQGGCGAGTQILTNIETHSFSKGVCKMLQGNARSGKSSAEDARDEPQE